MSHTPPFNRTRRRLLSAALGSLTVVSAKPAFSNIVRPGKARELAFENLHTGEKLKAVYWAGEDYQPDALVRIAWVLRDHRTNAVHRIAPELLDLLSAISARLNTMPAFSVISGYRSPHTNMVLAAASDGVARNSLHTSGMAIDIRMDGVPLARLRDTAKSLGLGGVGYYPRSNFVHVDVGRVRFW